MPQQLAAAFADSPDSVVPSLPENSLQLLRLWSPKRGFENIEKHLNWWVFYFDITEFWDQLIIDFGHEVAEFNPEVADHFWQQVHAKKRDSKIAASNPIVRDFLHTLEKW